MVSIHRTNSVHEVFEDVVMAVELEGDAFVEDLSGLAGDMLVEAEDVKGTFFEAWVVLFVAMIGNALETLDLGW